MIYRYITGFNEKFNKILFWNGIIFTWYFTNDKVFHLDCTWPYHILEKRAVIGRFFLLQLRMLRQLLGFRLCFELFVSEVDQLLYCETHQGPITCSCLWNILYYQKRSRSAQKQMCIPLCHFAQSVQEFIVLLVIRLTHLDVHYPAGGVEFCQQVNQSKRGISPALWLLLQWCSVRCEYPRSLNVSRTLFSRIGLCIVSICIRTPWFVLIWRHFDLSDCLFLAKSLIIIDEQLQSVA